MLAPGLERNPSDCGEAVNGSFIQPALPECAAGV